MTVSGLVGGIVLGGDVLSGPIGSVGVTFALLSRAAFHAVNVTAVAFWIVLLLLYFTQVRLSPAELDWERRMLLAEEMFRREKALGRGSWWM